MFAVSFNDAARVRTRIRNAHAGRCARFALAFALAACGADDDGEPKPDEGGVQAGGAVYALVTLVWGDGGPTGYVALSQSLEMPPVNLDGAREFPGYTSVAVADGQLLVNPSWDDLTIQRFQISDALAWTPTGSLSFVNEGAEAVSFHTQYWRRDQEAYLDVDVTGRVIWQPVALTIASRKTDTILPLQRDGLDLFAAYNRTQFAFPDTVVRPFVYHDQDWFRWSSDSQLVIYDATTNDPTAAIAAPCPGLDTITRDENGNTYLSTWDYPALHKLMGTGAAPCVVRLTPDRQLDANWNTDLTAMTGGRLVVNFRYIGAGKAIAAVLHAEEYGAGFDFSAFAQNTDDFWASVGRFHRVWLFDLNAKTAAPVAGVTDLNFVNPSFFHATVEGRTFVFLGDGSTNNPAQTFAYEIDAGGQATRRFTLPGTVTQWVRVR